MELRQLRYFVAVAEAGNISRAAKRIFLTQPALSRQVKALEAEIGQCLLKRRANSVRLTPAGELLLQEARGLLQHADQMMERVRATGTNVRLRVGYAPSMATGLLSAAVENFTQTHPGAQVELFDLSTTEMLTRLESGKLDVVLTVGREGGPKDLTWARLLQAPWKVVLNRKHPLAHRARLTPAEIAQAPLLAFCHRDYPEYWEILQGWLREHRQRPAIAGEYDGVDSLMAAVESGLGIALVALRGERLIPERACAKPVAHAPQPLYIAAGIRTDRTDDKALAVFIEELRAAARNEQ